VIPWRTLLWAGILLLLFVWLAGTNGPGLLLGLGVIVAGTAVLLWRNQRSAERSVLGAPLPSNTRFAPMRLVCLLAGHKWTTAAEALDPHDATDASAVSYAGDGDDTVVLVCPRCSDRKVVAVEDFRRLIGGVTGYGSRIDP
jgi:hypothetical protein